IVARPSFGQVSIDEVAAASAGGLHQPERATAWSVEGCREASRGEGLAMTERAGGEVAVRQNGQETAIDAPSLDGQVRVDLDMEFPHVRVPSEVGVSYRDEEEDDEEAMPDGGVVDRREVEMRGFGLSEEHATAGLPLSVVLLVASGALLGSSGGWLPLIGLVVASAGLFVGYVSVRSRWSGRS
ncbi:hypothetical protein, partial [Halarchaeum sp. P4]|uniref:hypothetical protein n=1 Tax=Halarchaeum sp. P4 TaxID=3421639 RepID=UPI003EC011C2